MRLAPMPNQWVLPSVTCQSCGEYLCATLLSRIAFVILAIGVILKVSFYFENPKLTGLQFSAMFLTVGTFFYFGVWPFMVRLKKWVPLEKYLPKSRVVGYGVYLVLPIIFIIAAFVLAAKYELGF